LLPVDATSAWSDPRAALTIRDDILTLDRAAGVRVHVGSGTDVRTAIRRRLAALPVALDPASSFGVCTLALR
jgi:hypothetical protein